MAGRDVHRNTISPGNQVKAHPDSSHDQKPKGKGVPIATWPRPSADNNILLTQNSSFSWIQHTSALPILNSCAISVC